MDTINVEVQSFQAVPVEPQGGTATVTVSSGGTVYYSDRPSVSASQNQGSIAVGGSVSFTNQAYLVSASQSAVSIVLQAPTGAVTWNIAAGNPILSNKLVSSDANPAFQINGDGTQNWGAGGASATDVSFFRRAAQELKSSGTLESTLDMFARHGGATQVSIGSTGPGGTSGITFQAGEAGSNLYRSAASTLRVDGTLDVGYILTCNGVIVGASLKTVRLDNGSGTALDGSVANYCKTLNADLGVTALGRGLRVAEGANCKQGTAVLAGGTVTVANTSVTANSRILLTTQTPGGTVGAPYVSARVAGTSFTITSTSATDTSTVAYQIFEPA